MQPDEIALTHPTPFLAVDIKSVSAGRVREPASDDLGMQIR